MKNSIGKKGQLSFESLPQVGVSFIVIGGILALAIYANSEINQEIGSGNQAVNSTISNATLGISQLTQWLPISLMLGNSRRVSSCRCHRDANHRFRMGRITDTLSDSLHNKSSWDIGLTCQAIVFMLMIKIKPKKPCSYSNVSFMCFESA